MFGVVNSAFCWGCFVFRGSALWHRAVVGHVSNLSTTETCWRATRSFCTPLRIGLFPLAPGWVSDGVGTTFALALLCFAFAASRRHRGAWGVRWSCTRREVAISESHYGEVSTAELDLVEALASVQVRSIGRVELLRLLGWVNIIQGLVVGSIIVKILVGLIHIAVSSLWGGMGLCIIPFIVSLFPSIIIIPVIGFHVVGIIFIGGVGSPLSSETTMVLMMSSTSDRLVVLSKQQEHGFLHLVAFHRRRLGSDKLSLFPCQPSLPQKVPSLDFSWESDVVVRELVVEMVMLSGVFQQRLAWASMKSREVLVEVSWQLDGLVVLEGLVEGFEDLLECSCLLNLLDREVLQEPRSCARQRANDGKQAFSFSLRHPHLHHIDGQSLSPLLIVWRSATEHRDVGVLGGRNIQASCARRSSSTWHSRRQRRS